jgi:Pyruvate/2-oxoacid:ferredoxin oxidoreductase gamma subunit
VTTTPVRDHVWSVLHDAFEHVAARHGEPVVLSSLAHGLGPGHPHTRYGFVLGPPGRLVAMAVGLRAALPRSPLVLVGATDAFTIGTNHLIHAARRNIGMTLVLLRADVFDAGESVMLDRAEPARASVSADIAPRPSPLAWAAALGASFVARASLRAAAELADLLDEAVTAGGFSVVGVTNDASLPTGVQSRQEWPEFFGTYRGWSDSLPGTRTRRPGPGAPRPPDDAPARVEVRIAGVGGQGIKLGGTVLSEAAGAQGLWATQIGDYGAATRGGASSVDVVFGSRPITYPGADHPDVRVDLSQAAADVADVAAQVLVADERLTAADGALVLPLVAIARERTGGQLSAGIVSLGAIAAITGWPSIDALAGVASRKVPERVAAANVAAMREAYDLTGRVLEGRR